MSNHLSPASASELSSYAISSSHIGASPAPSHHSTATSFSSSLPSPSAKMNSSSSSDNADFEAPAKPITCRWDDCGKVYYDPEVIYKHLCDDHVGRKSTNNLCLTCKWEGCDVSCAKRDHITSHIRVHTPLKPHNCDVCGKTFKRPQDLKKHERIHTEQHQQQRQHKAAQNAAARAYSMSEHAASFGAYPYPPPMHSDNGYLGYPAVPTQQGLYPSASAYPSAAYPGLPTSDYSREHYAHSASSASLSPMSSRIDTPQGSSPAPHHRQDTGSYMHLASGLDPRSKVTTDPTSYTYLAHGATTNQNLAGSKRGHEQVEDFFGDLRRKMAPAYDSHMAERLNQTFGVGGLDDVSLNAILSTFDPSAAYGQAPMNSGAMKMENVNGLARSHGVKQESTTDLAQLNAFLLQLGASAASTLGGGQHSHSLSASSSAASSASSSFSSQGHNAEFDMSSLSQYGLTNIPGFDESLLAGQQRNIAQLPSRAHHHYPDNYGYATQMHQPSFDNVRASRGPAIVPQLAPMEAGGHSYRRVEALTRAAPDSTEALRHDAYRSPVKVEDDAMEEDESDETTSQTSRFRSVSPAASSESGGSEAPGRRGSSSPSHGLYPRVSPSEASRRLPPLRSNSTASTSASISSLLDSDRRVSPSSSTRRESDSYESTSRHSAPAASPSPSASSSTSSSLYPSLVDRVSQMQGLGRPLPSDDEAMRREHVCLIRDLLIAINFPDKARAKVSNQIRLPPLRTASLNSSRVEEGEITPSASKDEELKDVESDRNSTPTPPGRSTLPTLRQLLNDMPEERTESRPMREREMECDV